MVLPARLNYHRTNPLMHGAAWIHGKLWANLPVEALDPLRGRAQTKHFQEQRAEMKRGQSHSAVWISNSPELLGV